MTKSDILVVWLDQRVPQGPGWFGQVRSILETIKVQPRSKIDTATKQDVNEMQASRALQINAIARNRPNPKSEKSQALFSLAWEEWACNQDKPALNIIENGAVDQKLWGF